MCFTLFFSTIASEKQYVKAEELEEPNLIEVEQTDLESIIEDSLLLENETIELSDEDFQLLFEEIEAPQVDEFGRVIKPLIPNSTQPIGYTVDATAVRGLGQYITVLKIIGIGTVAIYTGGIIIKGKVAKAGTRLYNSVKYYVYPYILGATIPRSLRKDGNTVDLGKFRDKYGNTPLNKNSGSFNNGNWSVEKDTAGHGGRKWKIKKSGKRKASLDGAGNIIAD